MKIYTNVKSRFNKTVLMSGNEIHFDGAGVAEVSKSVGESLLAIHDTLFTEQPKSVEIEVKSKEETKEGLFARIDELKKANENLLEQIVKLTEENEALLIENEDLKVKLEQLSQGEVEQADDEIRKTLEAKTVKELKDYCEEMTFPKEEWEQHIKKADLVNYIFSKVTVEGGE